MPSKTKLKNAAIAARSAVAPKIPAQLLDQLAQGPMTAESIQWVTTALKMALIERALCKVLGIKAQQVVRKP